MRAQRPRRGAIALAAGGSAVGRGRDGQPGRAGHARAAVTAVAPRILREVLLVIVLGVVELRRVEDLGRDLLEARLRELFLVRVARGFRELALLGRVHVDARAVLGADVVALAHAL